MDAARWREKQGSCQSSAADRSTSTSQKGAIDKGLQCPMVVLSRDAPSDEEYEYMGWLKNRAR